MLCFADIPNSSKIDAFDRHQMLVLENIDLSKIETSQTFISLSNNFEATFQRLRKDIEQAKEQDRLVSRVLKSLHYNRMKQRQETIDEAYTRTFNWIFDEDPDSTRPWSNFVRWLERYEGVYWVNGKAGSGKSTVRLCSCI